MDGPARLDGTFYTAHFTLHGSRLVYLTGSLYGGRWVSLQLGFVVGMNAVVHSMGM